MKRLINIIGIAVIGCTTLFAQTRAYVKVSGSSAWDGRENVSTDLTSVLTNDGYDEIWVSGSHTISTSITIPSSIKKIIGGFAGTEGSETERVIKSDNPFSYTSESTITLGSSGILHLSNGMIMDGFTITSSNSNYPIQITSGAKVSHLVCAHGAKQVSCTDGKIEQCYFGYNNADGAIVKTSGGSVVANCSFSNNTCLSGEKTPLFMEGKSDENILSVQASSILTNSYFYKNTAYKGGGACVANTVVSSCTFILNTSKKSGGGIYLMPNSYVENSFFDKNTIGEKTKISNDIYGNNCFKRERGVEYVASACSETGGYGETNITYDSGTASATYSATDYSANLLTTGDVIIDKGKANCTYQIIDSVHYKEGIDVAGKIRLTGSSVDVGASEFQQKRVQLWQKVILPDFVTDKTLVLKDDSLKLDSCQWIKLDQNRNIVLTATTSPQFKFKNWSIKEYGSETSSTDNPWSYTIAADYPYDSLNIFATLDIDNYEIKIVSNLPNGATFTSSEPRVYYGQELTINAKVKTGYQFQNWSFNGNIIATTACDTFAVKPNLQYGGTDTLIYKAELARDTCNVNVAMTPATGGNLSKPDYFLYDSLVTLIATPAVGLQVIKWTVNGDSVANTNEFNYLVKGDAEIVAYIDTVYYQLNGEVTNSNVTLQGLNRKYAAGQQATIKAVLPTGYQFEEWDAYKNGSETVSARWIDNPYTFTVNDNYRIVANVSHISINVTAGALPEGSATVTKNKDAYFYGDTAIITATIAVGYTIDDWRICTSGWTGYSCADSYSQAAGSQVDQTAVLKMKLTDNVVIYAQQRTGSVGVNVNTVFLNGIAISQAGEKQILISLGDVEPWNLQIFNICGQHVFDIRLTEKETFVSLPEKTFYLLKFTKGEHSFVEKIVVY